MGGFRDSGGGCTEFWCVLVPGIVGRGPHTLLWLMLQDVTCSLPSTAAAAVRCVCTCPRAGAV